jgi:hypothetical protein
MKSLAFIKSHKEIGYIIKILCVSMYVVQTYLFQSLPHSLLSPTQIHGYEKANEHVPFCVQVMYLKIVEQPTFSKPLYLTSFPRFTWS